MISNHSDNIQHSNQGYYSRHNLMALKEGSDPKNWIDLGIRVKGKGTIDKTLINLLCENYGLL